MLDVIRYKLAWRGNYRYYYIWQRVMYLRDNYWVTGWFNATRYTVTYLAVSQLLKREVPNKV